MTDLIQRCEQADEGMQPLFDAVAFSLEVRLAMATANISYRDLAHQIGSDQANIHRVAKKALNPSVETYLRLRRWLDERPDATARHSAALVRDKLKGMEE